MREGGKKKWRQGVSDRLLNLRTAVGPESLSAEETDLQEAWLDW